MIGPSQPPSAIHQTIIGPLVDLTSPKERPKLPGCISHFWVPLLILLLILILISSPSRIQISLTSFRPKGKAQQNRGFLDFVGLQPYGFGGETKRVANPSLRNWSFKFLGISVMKVR